jgi:hypothetical protein
MLQDELLGAKKITDDEIKKKEVKIVEEMIAQQAGDDDNAAPQDQDQDEDAGAENKEEDETVEKLLKMFLIATESPFLVDINLILMMKALPSKIVRYNLP